MRIATIGLSLVLSASMAQAGEFFERDGVAIRGYDPVAYFTAGKPAKGAAQYMAAHKGSTFHFASAENRDAFIANPAKYAPQYGGYCAFGTAGGYKAAIDPAAFTIVDGKLYLNYNSQVQVKWSADVAGYIRKADANWPEVMKQSKVIE